MSKKFYKGTPGKSVWENMNFQKGMVYNNEPQREGAAKVLGNLDVSKTGGTLTPRKPFFSTSFQFPENDLPTSLDNDTILFKSTQDTSFEFLINIGGQRKDKLYHEIPISKIEDVDFKDGDSFIVGEIEYRLLAIDAREYYEDGEVSQLGVDGLNALKDKIQHYLDANETFYAVYDKANDTDIDVYDRRLIWLYAGKDNNINLELLQDTYEDTNTVHSARLFGLMGMFDDELTEVHVPEYLGHNEFDFPIDNYQATVIENKPPKPTVYNTAGSNINIYQKESFTTLYPFKETTDHLTTPMIKLDSPYGRLDVSQIYEDLDIPYGQHFSVQLNNINYTNSKETHDYISQYKPWVRVDDIDGIAFLGTIKVDNEVKYKGLISLKYHIPLEGNNPNYERGAFKLESYDKNAFQIKFEDLNTRYSLNLLDPQVPGRRDYIGDDAEDFSYFTHQIPTIGVMNSNNQFVTQMAQGRDYTIRPYFVLPKIHDMEKYNGYFVKWDFFTDSEYYDNKIIRFFSSSQNFPSQGDRNQIYVDTLDENQHYRWDGDTYIKQDSPGIIKSTGWQLAFDAEGNKIDPHHYRSHIQYYIDTADDGRIIKFEPRTVVSQKETNDQVRIMFSKTHEDAGITVGNMDKFITEGKNFMLYMVPNRTDVNLISEEYVIDNPLGSVGEMTMQMHIRFEAENGGYIGQVPLADIGYTSGFRGNIVVDMNHSAIQAITGIEDTYRVQVREVAYEGTNVVIYSAYQLYWGDSMFGNDIQDGLEQFAGYNSVYLEGVTSIKTDEALFKEVKESSRGTIYAVAYLTRGTVEEGEIKESNLQLDITARVQAVTIKIRSAEETEQAYEHGQNLHECTGITFYRGHVILYGSPNAPNVIYMSDEGGNISYFPFKRALDQFTSDIIHVEPVKQGLIVFTTTDIYLVFETEDEMGNVFWVSQIVYTNLSINKYQRNTIRAIGRDILFMSQGSVLMLRPNPYVNDISDMFLQDISKNIQGILDNPVPFLTKTLMYYGVTGDIFTTGWKPKVEYYTVVNNKEVLIYMSVDVPNEEPIMFVLVFDRERSVWRVYHTRACAFPYNHKIFDSDEGLHVLMKNSNVVDKGTTLVLNENMNLWDFDEGYGRYFDIQSMKVSEGTFVYNNCLADSDEYENVKHPIHVYLNTGFLNTATHLKKRFHKAYLEMRNTDVIEMPLTIEFNIDGVVRQTGNQLRMTHITDPDDPNYGLISEEHGHNYEGYDFAPFQLAANSVVEGGTSLQTWQLGMQKFGPLNKLRIEFGISGKGRNPNLEFALKTTGKFELFGFGIVYKEQSNY